MRRLLFFAFGIALAACLAAQETTTAAQTAPLSKGQALVNAAKDTKAKRKKPATKTITNADVKKSKGKIVVLPAKKDPEATPPAEAGMQQKHDLNLKERVAATERVQTAQKKVDGLQKELDKLEQRYYEENDPNYRDDVIQKKFAQTKKQLQAAQQELADARDAMDGVAASPQK